MEEPNIFEYATSELSQDAFICWLVNWAQSKYKSDNELIHKCGVKLLDAFFEKAKKKKPLAYDHITVTKQFKRIDILVVINGKYAIIIEDKVDSENHSDQLRRYHQEVLGMGFSNENILPIYFKTGDQSNYREISANNYFRFSRQDFLDVLNFSDFHKLDNDIFKNYLKYIEKIDDEVNSYKISPWEKWTGRSWEGFFLKLQDVLGYGEWDYVNNQQGGFMAFYWHFKKIDSTEVYLVLEQENLCFKLSVENKDKRTVCRNQWHQRIFLEGPNHDLDITKPPRFGYGKTMTFGQLRNGYLQKRENEKIDIHKTVSVLRKAEKLLDTITI